MFPNYNTPMPMATQGMPQDGDMPDVAQSPVPLPAGLVGGEPGASPVPGLGAQPAPLPDMPGVGQGGASMPSVPGLGVQGAPAPNPMDAVQSEMEKWRAESLQRRKQREQFLQQLVSTNGLEQFLPKPTAKQMLSDALANFGMARLTHGQFTPIQTRRFEEAFRRHGAAVQDAATLLNSDRQDDAEQSAMQNVILKYQQLAERTNNDQVKADNVTAERQRKEAATSAALDFRKLVQTAGAPLAAAKQSELGAKAAAENAKAKMDSATARLLQSGGGSPANALANYVSVNNLDLTDPDDYKEYLKVAAELRDATKPKPNPNAGITEFHFPTKDGNIGVVSGPKGGPKTLRTLEAPEGYGNFSEKAKGEIVQLDNAKSLASDVMHILETTPTKDGSGKMLKDAGTGSLMDALKATAQQRLAYQMYMGGIGNKENPLSAIEQTSPGTGDADMDKLIQYTAMLQILGTRPFMAGIRNQKYIDMLKVHLPNPASDTGSFMYGKTAKLIPRWDDMAEDIKNTELHPVSASRKTPPRSTPGTPAKAAPEKKDAIITDPSQIKW